MFSFFDRPSQHAIEFTNNSFLYNRLVIREKVLVLRMSISLFGILTRKNGYLCLMVITLSHRTNYMETSCSYPQILENRILHK